MFVRSPSVQTAVINEDLKGGFDLLIRLSEGCFGKNAVKVFPFSCNTDFVFSPILERSKREMRPLLLRLLFALLYALVYVLACALE